MIGYVWMIAVGLLAVYGIILVFKKITDSGVVLDILKSILEWLAVGVAIGVILHFVVGIANVVMISGAAGALIGLLSGIRRARRQKNEAPEESEEAVAPAS